MELTAPGGQLFCSDCTSHIIPSSSLRLKKNVGLEPFSSRKTTHSEQGWPAVRRSRRANSGRIRGLECTRRFCIRDTGWLIGVPRRTEPDFPRFVVCYSWKAETPSQGMIRSFLRRRFSIVGGDRGERRGHTNIAKPRKIASLPGRKISPLWLTRRRWIWAPKQIARFVSSMADSRPAYAGIAVAKSPHDPSTGITRSVPLVGLHRHDSRCRP